MHYRSGDLDDRDDLRLSSLLTLVTTALDLRELVVRGAPDRGLTSVKHEAERAATQIAIELLEAHHVGPGAAARAALERARGEALVCLELLDVLRVRRGPHLHDGSRRDAARHLVEHLLRGLARMTAPPSEPERRRPSGAHLLISSVRKPRGEPSGEHRL
jgi:hypothetical protein